ncbi:hypothetical protein Tco_1143857 [Tanacetum coccineum]
MMTYLKHVGNFKHSDLKTKKFEEIQALYEKIKRSDEDFISIGSAKDERLIKKMNEKGIDSSKNEMVKEEDKEEEGTKKRKGGHIKMIQSDVDSEDEHKKCLKIVTFESILDSEIMEKKSVIARLDYEILDKKYPIIEWKTEYLGTKPQVDKAKHLEEINQNVVIRSNGQKRYFSTLMRVLSIFDRDDLNDVYQLKKIEEEDEFESESDGIPEAEKKFKQLASDEEMARKVQEESDEDFISIGPAKDERLIKKMNEKGIDSSKNEMVKEEDKKEKSTRKRKLGTKKKMKSRKRRFRQNTSEDDSEKENDELRLCLTIAPDEDKEINQNVVIRSNGQKRYFSTLMRVLSVFDRDDLNVVYQLVMERYQDEIPEGFDRVVWGDLMIMFNPDDEDKFWNSQQDWNVVSWKLHGSSGVHTLMTEAGLVIHMLVEKKYPLRKKVLLQMLELKLESEEDSTMTLELIRFVKMLVAELEPEDSNGDEEDL